MSNPGKILYGTANYEELVAQHGYFVDKTAYIQLLEDHLNPVYLRPRRFGKSLWCSILNNYYDINKRSSFDALFGRTEIGKNPTKYRNAYMVLHLDFSGIKSSGDMHEIAHSFNAHCNDQMDLLASRYRQYLGDEVEIDPREEAFLNLGKLNKSILKTNAPPLYITIDEYDNFANQLIASRNDNQYKQLTSEESFFKTFFKVIKSGRQQGAIANTFITGVLPITMDDLSSGYNIASFLTLKPSFASMLGYTQDEVDKLLDSVYRDYELDPGSRKQVSEVIKSHYNGYQFVSGQVKLYNPTILAYFLNELCEYKTIPEFLTDENIKIDIEWVKRLTLSNHRKTEALVDQLLLQGRMPYDRPYLKEKFNMSQFFNQSYYPIAFFYLGMLTRESDYYMKIPNINMRTILVEYFNEIHNIDVSTRYADMMEKFSRNPDLKALFAAYWEQYISQFPEAIFQQVNENFYRSTFYELCRRYLSHLFTWNLERSYPDGRTDLEFVGKYHTQFASLRYVIEFKYYSNTEVKKQKIDIDTFQLVETDSEQIEGYAKGLIEEYPEAKISKFVIYCFGNQGYRVFCPGG